MVKRFVLGSLFFAVTLCFPMTTTRADSANVTIDWALFGPAGDYKVELFEVGAPYPSRQTIVNHFAGISNYHDTWYAIVSRRAYFVRVTYLTANQAKQTHSFAVTPQWPEFDYGTLNWYLNYLGH